MKIGTILDQIDLGSMALPEFQRGYVWNRDQVRGLMASLYQKHPVGSLLVWVTKTENAAARGDGNLAPGWVELLLDGQQRITSLYGIIRGKPPKFFDGNEQAFTDLYFNIEDETFEFYGPVKMKDDPRWISVTDLMQEGVGRFIGKLYQNPELVPNMDRYINRLTAIENIKEIDLHIERVTGDDKTVDVVVDIFNRVNSGGTKLSKGDLALAKICAEWPEARDVMKAKLAKWRQAGFDFKLDWLLRCVNAVLTGEAQFAALRNVSTPEFRAGLEQTEEAIDDILNLLGSRLGLDHNQVLPGRFSFALLARYFAQRNGQLADEVEQNKVLYWYINSFIWGRYIGPTETNLNQDLELIEERDGAIDRLIERLQQTRGDLLVRPSEFMGYSRGARFYPFLYMMTRVHHARDWGTGIELSAHLLGKLSRLELHHIFPASLLYKHGYSRRDVNQLANFTFLTQETNLKVSNRDPQAYLEEYAARHPGAVASHWIPMDRELWKIENYLDFLAARRELLAQAANDFLSGLLGEEIQGDDVKQPEQPRERRPEPVMIPGGTTTDDEEELILGVNDWIEEQGLPTGEYLYELVDEATGAPIAILDLAWPDGMQPGYSQPAALLVDESKETEEAANRAGYRFFTSITELREYVAQEILAVPEDQAAD